MCELIAEVNPMPSTAIWEYGLAIGIFATCAIGFWRLILLAKCTFETISAEHNTTLKELTKQHKDERTEWRTEANRREQSLTEIVQLVVKYRDDKPPPPIPPP